MTVRRHELTDAEWERLARLLPPEKPKTGKPNKSHRLILNGILWKLRTGAPWRDLPERYGPWETVYTRVRRWRPAGVGPAGLSGRQGLRQSGATRAVSAAGHPAHDPAAVHRSAQRAVRPGDLSAARASGAADQPLQTVPQPGHALRQARRELSRALDDCDDYHLDQSYALKTVPSDHRRRAPRCQRDPGRGPAPRGPRRAAVPGLPAALRERGGAEPGHDARHEPPRGW